MWQPAETPGCLCFRSIVRLAAAFATLYILGIPAVAADSGLLNANLGRWIDNEAAPGLAETLANHPRFRGETIRVVSMRDSRPLDRASRLHQAVEQRLTQQLLQYPGVRIVWNESLQTCGTPQPVAYLLGVEIEKDGSTSHKANIGMIDVSESVWVSGLSLNWQGRLTSTERDALSSVVDTVPRGTIDSPMQVTDSKRIAELMQQNLRCALPDGLRGPLYLAPADPGAVAQISGQLRTALARTPFAAVTRSSEDADWVLSLQSEAASGRTHQLQLLLEDTERKVTQQVAAVYVVGLESRQQPAQTSDTYSTEPTLPTVVTRPAAAGDSDDRLLSIMRLTEVDQLGVCRDSNRRFESGQAGACAEVSFDLLKPAYLFVFSTSDRRLDGLSCAIWRDRSPGGEQRYRLRLPALDSGDRPAIGVYAIASGRRDVATRLDRHLRTAQGMCGTGKPTDLSLWLTELERLIDEPGDDVQWQAIQLANTPAGVRRL